MHVIYNSYEKGKRMRWCQQSAQKPLHMELLETHLYVYCVHLYVYYAAPWLNTGSYSSKVLVGKDAVLLLQLMEDLDLLFAHHGMFLLQGLLQDAARQLQDG
jgi:hypothetical protein